MKCGITAALSMRGIARRLVPVAARGEALRNWSRPVAAFAFLFWIGGVTAGKFLPYAHHILMVS